MPNDDQKHEQLIHLAEESGRLIEKQTEPEEIPKKDSKGRVSQWALLKIIKEGKRGVLLSDLCKQFDIHDSEDDRLQFGLGQLIRAGRIERSMLLRDGRITSVFKATGVGDKDEKKK